ncbi:sodium channel modifier 1 isoform X10 [Zonotrichia albicollis]|uniref:sodium channel modifier 1 isoform X10 n=1 Tax=Zonotrichia albicollis TaxID=44394 RepID=UPI003D81108D
MSFKRDESDPGPLGALQRRRVAELLASAIPEDEALLLRDGRLACSLCPQRPVCDTLQTLLLHRAGRKHLDNLLRSFGRPRCPQVTPEGPQVTPQEAPGVQAPLLARTRRLARSALLTTAPYNSCCRRDRTKGSSSSRAGIPGMIPKNSQRPPEPSRNPGNAGNAGNAESPAHREGAARDGRRGRKGNSQSPKEEGPSPERLRILRHHLHLRSSLSLCPSRGWLQDPAGNWVKDGNAEFDSDEEEPPPLPPA